MDAVALILCIVTSRLTGRPPISVPDCVLRRSSRPRLLTAGIAYTTSRRSRSSRVRRDSPSMQGITHYRKPSASLQSNSGTTCGRCPLAVTRISATRHSRWQARAIERPGWAGFPPVHGSHIGLHRVAGRPLPQWHPQPGLEDNHHLPCTPDGSLRTTFNATVLRGDDRDSSLEIPSKQSGNPLGNTPPPPDRRRRHHYGNLNSPKLVTAEPERAEFPDTCFGRQVIRARRARHGHSGAIAPA